MQVQDWKINTVERENLHKRNGPWRRLMPKSIKESDATKECNPARARPSPSASLTNNNADTGHIFWLRIKNASHSSGSKNNKPDTASPSKSYLQRTRPILQVALILQHSRQGTFLRTVTIRKLAKSTQWRSHNIDWMTFFHRDMRIEIQCMYDPCD